MNSQHSKKPATLLRHVVLFAFNDTATSAQIQGVEEAFCDLPDKIEEVYDFEWGLDVSPEKISQGYTHCFLVTFLNEKDRDTYLVHPVHQEFVANLQPHLAKALVVDYWSRR